MDGRRPRGMMFARSGADPALPVGGANMSEPQDAASESIPQGWATIQVVTQMLLAVAPAAVLVVSSDTYLPGTV